VALNHIWIIYSTDDGQAEGRRQKQQQVENRIQHKKADNKKPLQFSGMLNPMGDRILFFNMFGCY
jgi:hypothetical protein